VLQIDKIRKRLSGSLDGAAAEEDGDIRYIFNYLNFLYLKYLFSIIFSHVDQLYDSTQFTHLTSCEFTRTSSGIVSKLGAHVHMSVILVHKLKVHS
jgi:hypothetical protein